MTRPAARRRPAEQLPAGHPWAQPQLRQCDGCGLLQEVPALAPGMRAQCARCRITMVSITTHPLGHSIALTLAALMLMAMMWKIPKEKRRRMVELGGQG